MSGRIAASVPLLLWLGIPLIAGDIDGTIIIERKLTKPRVTASTGAYQRGVSVELGRQPETDPLAFERSHVAIWVEGDGPVSPSMAIMEQKNRLFAPDILVVPAGSSVSFPNMDPIFHNVFSLSKPKNFDLGNYSKGQTRSVTFAKPGIVFVNCHLHPNMAASIVVTPNDRFARSDGAGRFLIPNVPAGTYTVVAWHKTAGFFRQTVTVPEKGSVPAQFFIPFDENGVAHSAHR